MAVIGLGIDVVDIERAVAMLASGGDRMLDRMLVPGEREYVTRMPHAARHLAGRLAAKEAVYKALQALPEARAVGWRDIEVERDGDGRPGVRLHGIAADLLARVPGARVHLSLSHSDRSAVAVAVIESEVGS